MAAYAALVSLMNTLNNIQIHPRVSAFLDKKHIQSLHKLIDFLLDFIDSREEEVLSSLIACAAHAVEDLIESHVVEHIHAESSSLLDPGRAIKFLNSVAEMVVKFKETNLLQHTNSMPATSSKPLSTITKNVMVGLDEELIQIMGVLTGEQPRLQIVPIVGMGGIGKTTLARNVYENLLIVDSFDVRAWVTVSQEYSVKNIFRELLSCIIDRKMNKSLGAFDCETDLEAEDHQLRVKLYQSLFGRRYLIVLDDIWNIEAWDKIKNFFPNNDSRSRIVITSRISNVATHLSSSSVGGCFVGRFFKKKVASEVPYRIDILDSSIPITICSIDTYIQIHWGSNIDLYKQMYAPSTIWYMTQLRHLQFHSIFLPDPPQDDLLLPDLQTLTKVVNFSFTEEVCKRVPNIKKFEKGLLAQKVVFEQLQSLLGRPERDLAFVVEGPKWSTAEGAFPFPRLKILEIHCPDLIKWSMEKSKLEEIPSGVGERVQRELRHFISRDTAGATKSW